MGSGANQIPDMGKFPISLGGSGWGMIPSGLIIQWGIVPVSGTYTLTFKIPFPTAAYCLVASSHTTTEAGIAATAIVNCSIRTNSQANLLCAKVANGALQPYDRSVYWIAIGC